VDGFALVARASQPAPGIADGLGVWQVRSTREVPARDRFEFWRQFPAGAHMERPLGAPGNFFGEFKFAVTPDVMLGEFDVDPCVSRFGPGRDDSMVDIGLINTGTMHIRYGRDRTLVLRSDAGPVVFDPARPMTIVTTRSDVTYLRLPRTVVVAALGSAAIPRGAAVRPLPPGALVAQLAASMRGAPRGGAQAAGAVADALHTLQSLALVALANVRGAAHHWPDVLAGALYTAACCRLKQHLADAQLTVDIVAAELGCSRAQLYRLFAARGQTVAGHLRELRLQHAAALLRTRPAAAVGLIAAHCGYGEPIAFDRAFRRRFGMTPSDWRAAA
jgi:AraC-like DNA-binding protein